VWQQVLRRASMELHSFLGPTRARLKRTALQLFRPTVQLVLASSVLDDRNVLHDRS
jgi:hypothetical protein